MVLCKARGVSALITVAINLDLRAAPAVVMAPQSAAALALQQRGRGSQRLSATEQTFYEWIMNGGGGSNEEHIDLCPPLTFDLLPRHLLENVTRPTHHRVGPHRLEFCGVEHRASQGSEKKILHPAS